MISFDAHFIIPELTLLVSLFILIFVEVWIRVNSKGSSVVYNNDIHIFFIPISFMLLSVVSYGMLKLGSLVDLRT